MIHLLKQVGLQTSVRVRNWFTNDRIRISSQVLLFDIIIITGILL